MLGAIIGDIVGSRFEWNNIKTKEFDFLTYKGFATDDSIMSLAVAQAILDCKGDYNFLGDVEIPEEWQDGEQDAGAPDKNEQEETA